METVLPFECIFNLAFYHKVERKLLSCMIETVLENVHRVPSRRTSTLRNIFYRFVTLTHWDRELIQARPCHGSILNTLSVVFMYKESIANLNRKKEKKNRKERPRDHWWNYNKWHVYRKTRYTQTHFILFSISLTLTLAGCCYVFGVLGSFAFVNVTLKL